MEALNVELISQTQGLTMSGITRYRRELHKHLLPYISIREVEQAYPPLADRIDPLRYFPIGIRSHQKGSILHFMEDFGCSQMLWHPTRPAIATSHDIGFLSWQPEAKMHRAIDRLLLYFSYLGLKRMDAVIAVSEYSRRQIIRQLKISPERVFTVHSGNDGSHFKHIAAARAKLEERYGFPKNSRIRVLLYVGAEFPRKNLRMVLQTLKRLPSNVRLLKVGAPGGERFRIHTRNMITELGLADRVVFFDQIPEEDLPIFYSAADIYVCASHIEGFCHPVVEAMSCGTPIVCSNAGALPEVARDAAILVSPEDYFGFIEAIRAALYDDSLRQQMILHGLQQAASFSWERTAERVIEVYRKVVKND